MAETVFNKLNHLLNGELEKNIGLEQYSTFRIGGPARFFYQAKNSQDLIKAINASKGLKIPVRVIGGGSNILFADKGFDGLIIKLASNNIVFKDNYTLIADAGNELSKLIILTVSRGWQGLQWAAGIPGTLGGAIRGNAGAYGNRISDIVIKVKVLRQSKQIDLHKKQIKFGYRDSLFKHNDDIVISAELKFRPGNKENLTKKFKEILSERNRIHDVYVPSCGCIFKNIQIDKIPKYKVKDLKLPKEIIKNGMLSAGYLVEQMGLKGKKIGKAKISENHANWILNTGGATSDEIVQLISLIKMAVRNSYGIQLEEEIQYIF